MKDERYDVVIVFLANSVLLLWTVLPDRGMIHPFPLSDQEIPSQTYIWIATIYAAFLLMSWVTFRLSERSREFFNAVFILQACQFIEYFINYNETWFKVYNVPINIAMLRFPILFFYAVRTFVTWSR